MALSCSAALSVAIGAPAKHHAPAHRVAHRAAHAAPATGTAAPSSSATPANTSSPLGLAGSPAPQLSTPVLATPSASPLLLALAATPQPSGSPVGVVAAAPVAGPATVTAIAAPAPADTGGGMLHYLDQRGLLDPVNTVASRSTELFSQVKSRTEGLVSSAMNFLGVPYKRGGNSVETGFDCSGFTRHVFETMGLLLPHRADEQAKDPGLLKVDLKDLKPGDLVFFNTLRRTFSHVGIYLGEGKFIHSPRTGESVRVEDMRIAYWAHRFTGARRAPALDQTADTPTAALLTANLNASVAPSLAPVAGTVPGAPGGSAAPLAGLSPLLAGPDASVRPGPGVRRMSPSAGHAPRPAVAPRATGSAAPLPGDDLSAPPLGER